MLKEPKIRDIWLLIAKRIVSMTSGMLVPDLLHFDDFSSLLNPKRKINKAGKNFERKCILEHIDGTTPTFNQMYQNLVNANYSSHTHMLQPLSSSLGKWNGVGVELNSG